MAQEEFTSKLSKAQSEFDKKSGLLGDMLDRISDGLIALDKNWQIVYFNYKAARILNREKPEDLIGKNIWIEFPEAVGNSFYLAFHQAMKTQEMSHLQDYFEPLDCWFDIRIYPSSDGLTLYFIDITETKRTESVIHELEEHLGLAVHAANIGLWDWDLQSNKVYFSPHWKKQIGYKDHEISNDFHEWSSRVHPQDLESALQTALSYVANPYPNYHNEFRFHHKDGTYRWILAQADLLYDEQGKPSRMLGSHIDITERKHSETVLREHQQQLALIYDTVEDIIYYLTIEESGNFRFTSVNRAFLSTTGLSAEQVINKRVEEVIPESSLSFVLEKYEEAIRTKTMVRWEETSDYPSGRLTGEVRISPIFDEDGHCTNLVGSIHDVTKRKLAEDTLRLSEERLRLSTEIADVAVWEYDLVTNQMSRSENHDHLYGLERQEVWVIDTFLNATHPDDRDFSNQIIQDSIAPGGPDKYSFDFRVIWSDQSVHWLVVTGEVTKRDTIGTAMLICGVLIDITERKQAEEELRASEKLFSNAFHTGPAGMTITRISDGKFVDANESFCEMFEFSRDAVVGHTSTELNMWTLEERKRLIQQQVAVGGVHNFELVAQSKSGKLINVLFSSKEMQIKGETCLLTTLINITQRNDAEKALDNSEKRFRTLIEKSFDFIILLDADVKPFYVSPPILTILGYTPEEFIHRGRSGLIHPDDDAEVEHLYTRLLKYPNETILSEIRVRHKNGTWCFLRWIGHNLLHDPAVGAIVSNLSDITERKQAEEALYASEQRFSHIFEVSPVATVLTSLANSQLVDVNESMEVLTGYSRDELIGKTSLELNLFVDPKVRKELAKKTQDTRTYKDVEIQLRQKSGEIRDILLSSDLIELNDKRYAITMAHDITERNQAEVARRESEEKYYILVEHASDGIFVSNSQGYYIDVNTSSCKMLGYSREELIGKHLSELVTSDNLAVQPLKVKDLKAGKALISERILKRKDGSTISVEISGTQLPNGNLLGLVRDITERKQAEQALQRLNQRLTILHEIDKNIITAHSADKIVDGVLKALRQLIYCERATVLLFDEYAEEVVVLGTAVAGESTMQKSFRASVKGDPWAEIIKTGQPVLISDTTKIETFTSDIWRNLVNEGICSFLVTPLMISGHLIGSLNLLSKTPNFFTSEYQEIATEVANQLAIGLHQVNLREQIEQVNRELEQRISKRTSQLEAKNRELETFTYTVSHDLKAPLRGIDGYSRLLISDYMDLLGDEGRFFVQNIRTATDQMNQLIDDLLSYSRLERRPLQSNKVKVKQMAETLVAERASDILSSSAIVTVTLPDILISADSDGLVMAWRNLLDNALKFSSQSEKPVINISGHETENSCILWVEDNGIGFDMKYHDRILQIFQRLHRVEQYGGTGIGLAIVQKAMERMGGRVWAESEPGKGSKFYLEVPK